jgi:hypothetical protein
MAEEGTAPGPPADDEAALLARAAGWMDAAYADAEQFAEEAARAMRAEEAGRAADDAALLEDTARAADDVAKLIEEAEAELAATTNAQLSEEPAPRAETPADPGTCTLRGDRNTDPVWLGDCEDCGVELWGFGEEGSLDGCRCTDCGGSWECTKHRVRIAGLD